MINWVYNKIQNRDYFVDDISYERFSEVYRLSRKIKGNAQNIKKMIKI